jgi:hypothetical protein
MIKPNTKARQHVVLLPISKVLWRLDRENRWQPVVNQLLNPRRTKPVNP